MEFDEGFVLAARDAAAKLVGLTSGGLPAATVAALLLELIAAFPGQTRTQKGIAPVRFEEQDGSIAAAGYTLARCLSGGAPTFRHVVHACLDLILFY